jgi:hypothetical protein
MRLRWLLATDLLIDRYQDVNNGKAVNFPDAICRLLKQDLADAEARFLWKVM